MFSLKHMRGAKPCRFAPIRIPNLFSRYDSSPIYVFALLGKKLQHRRHRLNNSGIWPGPYPHRPGTKYRVSRNPSLRYILIHYKQMRKLILKSRWFNCVLALCLLILLFVFFIGVGDYPYAVFDPWARWDLGLVRLWNLARPLSPSCSGKIPRKGKPITSMCVYRVS